MKKTIERLSTPTDDIFFNVDVEMLWYRSDIVEGKSKRDASYHAEISGIVAARAADFRAIHQIIKKRR